MEMVIHPQAGRFEVGGSVAPARAEAAADAGEAVPDPAAEPAPPPPPSGSGLSAQLSDKVAIEIVTFGPGIDLLRPENPNRKMVESLVAQGARFDICLNTVDTLEREAGKRPEFIAAATPVQVGVAQILFLTENGYTLVRP